MRFPVVLHTDDGVRFGVTVPDLPGCFSGGDTFVASVKQFFIAINYLQWILSGAHGLTFDNV